MNNTVISAISLVSHTETAMERATDLARQSALLIVTIVAIVSGVTGYAYKALRAWREAHGKAFAASVIRTTLVLTDRLQDLLVAKRNALVAGR